MTSFRFDGGRPDAFEKLFVGKRAAIANAAQKALAIAGRQISDGGRASIAAAGFPASWQDGLTVKVYPEKDGGGALYVNHDVPFAIVFEQGAVINGEPLLWLPLPACPAKIGGANPTPSRYQKLIGPLRYVPAKPHPLLVAKTSTPPKEPPVDGVRRLSGPRREKASALRAGAAHGGYDVPLFIGIPTVSIGKKFDVFGVVERAYADLASHFEASLKEG